MDMEKKRVVLLGATGSIGQNSCAILAANRERFETVAVAARSSLDGLADSAIRLGAKVALFDLELCHLRRRDRGLVGTA